MWGKKNGVTSLFLNRICRVSSITWLLILLLLVLLLYYLQERRCPQVLGKRFSLRPAMQGERGLQREGETGEKGLQTPATAPCSIEKAANGSSQPNKPPRRPAAALSSGCYQRPCCHPHLPKPSTHPPLLKHLAHRHRDPSLPPTPACQMPPSPTPAALGHRAGGQEEAVLLFFFYP